MADHNDPVLYVTFSLDGSAPVWTSTDEADRFPGTLARGITLPDPIAYVSQRSAEEATRRAVEVVTAERDEAKRACRNALENFTNNWRATRCVSCEGKGGVLDADGSVTESCDGCGGTGGEVDRLERRLAHCEKWKMHAERVGLEATTRAINAESALAAERAKSKGLVAALKALGELPSDDMLDAVDDDERTGRRTVELAKGARSFTARVTIADVRRIRAALAAAGEA